MNFKAVISNCGDEKLYKNLSSELERRLPKDPVSWKRSHRRPEKKVVLQASFSKFNSSELGINNIDNTANLTAKPLLHVYWTSCVDNDKYKSEIKNQIINWQKHLFNHRNNDWLIVHVFYQDHNKPTKTKIQLPRSSVFDKIKSDFSQGKQERCIQLWEPDRETLFTKSSESWDILLNQFRESLLQSFGRHLESFEEKIRSKREKYADPNWSFLDYFIAHEDLAFIYQSITLNEDALIQYDEVNALLSQFIINCSGKELPTWLAMLVKAPTNWDGVDLSTKVAEKYKEIIHSNAATLIQLRNYIFLRQCKLLGTLQRKWEIPSRLLEFLLAVTQELKLLEIDAPNYIVACWIILTCLQLLPSLEKEARYEKSFYATIAQVYDLMRQKYHLIGQVTGLYSERELSDQEKDIIARLKTGFGTFTRPNNSTIALVHEALSSASSYQKIYIELTKNCIDKYSKINRLHFNMYVGIDLAKFYLHHGQYLEAEPLLEKAWSIYKNQNWQTLYTDVLKPLASCQLKHGLHDRYLNSVTLLSCAKCLSQSTREFYSEEVLKLANDKTLKLPVTGCEPVFHFSSITNDLVRDKGHIGDTIKINVIVVNNLTMPVVCKRIFITAKHRDLSDPDSFSENLLSARKSLFEQKDYGLNVTLSPHEKPPVKVEPKEPLTPSGLLKRIKSHRRTWSKNKNENTETPIVEKNIAANGTVQANTSTIPNTENATTSERDSVVNTSNVNKFLFESEEPTSANQQKQKNTAKQEVTTSGSTQVDSHVPRRSSLLELAQVQSDGNNTSKNNEDIEDDKSKKDSDVLPLDLSQIILEDSSTPIKCGEESESSAVLEEMQDIKLTTTEDITLNPGENKMTLSAKVTQEGKYTFQSVNCVVGNLSFFHSLASMSRKTNSFFVVADPPHITWTTDYLVEYVLTGSKQRIYVTLMNGPGVIIENSTLCIFSKTGLKFFTLDESDIQIFPLERNGIARNASASVTIDEEGDNAYLKLPRCQPYERVNIFFDVMAPMHQEIGESSTYQHEINFSCEWLENLVPTLQRLDLMFYEPFQMKCESIVRVSSAFIKLTICGVNPVHLIFSKPTLRIEGKDEPLNIFCNEEEFSIYNIEETTFLWKLSDSDLKLVDEEGILNAVFFVNFKAKHNDRLTEQFSKKLKLKVRQSLYAVDVLLDKENPCKSIPCNATVTVQKLSSAPTNTNVCIKLDSNEHIWKLANPKVLRSQNLVISFTESEQETASRDIEVICTASGLVSLPEIFLCKVNEVKQTEERGSIDLYTAFEPGEITYLFSGKIVTVGEEHLPNTFTPTTTEV